MNVKARHTQNNFYTHGAVRLCNDLLYIIFFPAAASAAAVAFAAATAASVAVLLQPLTA